MQHYNELPPFLTLADLMVIFVVAASTICRWTAEARAGKSRFPLPLDMGRNGRKGKLLWSRESITAFQQQAGISPIPNAESAVARAKRHRRAIESLAAQGVKLTGLPELQDQTKGGAQ